MGHTCSQSDVSFQSGSFLHKQSHRTLVIIVNTANIIRIQLHIRIATHWPTCNLRLQETPWPFYLSHLNYNILLDFLRPGHPRGVILHRLQQSDFPHTLNRFHDERPEQ